MLGKTELKFVVALFVCLFIAIPAYGADDFIKAPNGTYWKIDVGLARKFTSSASIEGYGLNKSDAKEVDQATFDKYQIGEPLPERKRFSRTIKVGAQDWGTVEISLKGWTLIEGPNVANTSQHEIKDKLDKDGNIIAKIVRVYNTNASFVGAGKSRDITVAATLEKE